MPYTKIEDCPATTAEPIDIHQSVRVHGVKSSYKTKFTGKITGHTIWKCWSCKAMAVTEIGVSCPKKCAKCGR